MPLEKLSSSIFLIPSLTLNNRAKMVILYTRLRTNTSVIQKLAEYNFLPIYLEKLPFLRTGPAE